METLIAEYGKLEKTGNLEKTIDDVQRSIDLLQHARDTLPHGPEASAKALDRIQKPLKVSTDKVTKDLTGVYNALKSYSKALDKKITTKPFSTADTDNVASHPALINRAIAMHLLREGQFGVASTFMEEANAHPPHPEPTASNPNPYITEWRDQEFAAETLNSKQLQEQFSEMYHILEQLREGQNLGPAIAWARKHSQVLEARGSNLEFELCRLQFVLLFTNSQTGDEANNGPQRAWAYARSTFGPFQRRYQREIQQISGALAFSENLGASPYGHIFYNRGAWSDIAASFTREFCSLLGMSADSPLYIAATAGAIALPTLLKLQTIMKEKRTEWTTQDELPVEIPLPPNYHFHSIFVCPVSKEQTTDDNPPMMLPCGHVIAAESLNRISKGSRFKCPYCPQESHPKEAIKVFL